ncbi:MAG: hypothetical protein HY906_19995 [Deltaproteobacteria bacterium]|nr:hypothetical protein [Deltaproteobacteria bacterium]
MLCLHYQDEGERARAVASIARRCRRLDSHLIFVGPAAACETTREAISGLEPSWQSCLEFRPLSLGNDGLGGERAGAEAIKVIRAVFAEVFAVHGPAVAWVEGLVTPHRPATETARCAYHDAFRTLHGENPITVIRAFPLADVAERALGTLLEGADSLISAQLVLPECPSWLISRTRADPTPVGGIPASPSTPVPADPIVAPLFQAEKLAALGQLAAGVAHELGNPLAIISSSLQYLHQRLAAANDPASDFTMTALQNVERMHGLLRSMLDFAAVKRPRLEPIDLTGAVSEILRFTSPECVERGITVEASFDPSLPPAWVDPCGLKQIMLNLIKNALDALLQGGHALRVGTRLRAEERVAVVEVENDGPPIPAEVSPTLFRPFCTTKDGGTGLGLYLSRQIARDHGGELAAENLPAGVRFTLTLPLDRRNGDEHATRPDRRR